MVRAPALALLTLLALSAGCRSGDADGPRTLRLHGPTMGATYEVQVVTSADGAADEAALGRAIRGELDRIDALMSTWNDESELSRFNASTSLEPFPLSRETFEVLRWAKEVSAITDGALDVTVGPLLEAWGFGPDADGPRQPTDEEIARLLQAVGVDLIVLDEGSVTVRKLQPKVRCELSSLAPGYAADRIWDLLDREGLTDYLIDVGGELRGRGTNDAGDAWQIAVERPDETGRSIEAIVSLRDMAIATSGDYRNYYEVEGRRLPHILDPRTGAPVAHGLASVTVLDPLTVRADALSTALLVLGPEEGLRRAEALDVPAFFLVRDKAGGFQERMTTGFAPLLEPPPVGRSAGGGGGRGALGGDREGVPTGTGP